jgi:hypothetical protein
VSARRAVRFAVALGAFALAITASGCGKTAAEKEPEVATGKQPTEFQKSRQIGHYSTLDGTSGFILDRTQDPWIARLDGTDANEPLVWHGAKHESTDYISPNHKVWLRVAKESGTVMLFQGPNQHEGVRVTRDADAKSLHSSR